jgi:hypothetical protein
MMAMAVVWIAPDTEAIDVEPQHVMSLLQRHTQTSDRLQHLRVRAGPDGASRQLVIFGFVMAHGSKQARDTLRGLAEKAIAAEPQLRHWRVI